MKNTVNDNNIWYDGKGVHADHLGVSLRDLMRVGAQRYKPGDSRYFDIIVRDVFVGRLALKLNKDTKEVVSTSLYPGATK